jgi:hypothetical protein
MDNISNKLGADLTFIEILFAIIIGQLLVSVWQNVIENFTFRTLNLNKKSTYHTLIIAVVATLIFLLYLFSSPTIFYAIFETDTGGNLVPPLPNLQQSKTTTIMEKGDNNIEELLNKINSINK